MTKRLAVAVLLFFGLTLALRGAVIADGVATGWLRVNPSGFGTAVNSAVNSLADFNGQLYAAATNYSSGAQVWRSPDGLTWTAAMTDGFGSLHNGVIDHLIVFNGQLYAGTENATNGGEVWRSANGTGWERVVSAGFGDADHAEVIRLAVFGGKVYASTWSYDPTEGTEIWRSDIGSPGFWARVVNNGFGDPYNASAPALEVFRGCLCAGTQNGVWAGSTLSTHGAEVWCSSNGANWARVGMGGFGDLNNYGISALAAFSDCLYASTTTQANGIEVWRCQACSGSDWTRVVTNSFGNPNMRGMTSLEVFAGRLYLVAGNPTTGMEVWRTPNGTTWEQVGFGGLGDSKNRAPYWDSSVTVYNGRLFVGTWNLNVGGEIWMYLPNRGVLPIVQR